MVRLLLALALVMYALACALPAIDTVQVTAVTLPGSPQHTGRYSGIELLLQGWLAPLAALLYGSTSLLERLQFAWYANPLLYTAWLEVFQGRWRTALIAGAAAFIVGMNTFTAAIPAGYEGMGSNRVTGLQIGGYLWFGSMMVTVVAALVGYRGGRQAQVASAR